MNLGSTTATIETVKNYLVKCYSVTDHDDNETPITVDQAAELVAKYSEVMDDAIACGSYTYFAADKIATLADLNLVEVDEDDEEDEDDDEVGEYGDGIEVEEVDDYESDEPVSDDEEQAMDEAEAEYETSAPVTLDDVESIETAEQVESTDDNTSQDESTTETVAPAAKADRNIWTPGKIRSVREGLNLSRADISKLTGFGGSVVWRAEQDGKTPLTDHQHAVIVHVLTYVDENGRPDSLGKRGTRGRRSSTQEPTVRTAQHAEKASADLERTRAALLEANRQLATLRSDNAFIDGENVKLRAKVREMNEWIDGLRELVAAQLAQTKAQKRSTTALSIISEYLDGDGVDAAPSAEINTDSE